MRLFHLIVTSLPCIPYKMSNRITRSRAAEHTVVPVVVATVLEPHNIITEMPPAIPIEDFKKSYFGFRKLPFILQKIQEFDQKLKHISKD